MHNECMTREVFIDRNKMFERKEGRKDGRKGGRELTERVAS